MGYSGFPTEEDEENITNRFAAELLMPAEVFKQSFLEHMKELGIKSGKVKVDDLVRVMVMQMNAFMVPYEAVRRRLVEIGLMQQSAADFLESKEEEILHLVELLTQYQNSYLEKGTGRKTISGIREFIDDEDDAELYEQYFPELYEEMREYLEIKGSQKQIEKLAIPKGQTIYTYRRAGMSLGDVHMILMAFFMRLPIILSEDGDIEFLRSVAKRKISSDSYDLEIYNVMDLIMMIAQKEDTTFSKKELKKVVLNVKERANLAEVNEAWDKSHSNV